jgi:hypothetical protein
MADPLSPQVGGGILFCACEANVSVANKAEALRRRCCCCKGLPHDSLTFAVPGSALRSPLAPPTLSAEGVTPRRGAVDNDFRYRRCLPASRCCLHTHTSRKSTPLCRVVMTALDPAARARLDRATLGWCGSREGRCDERDGWTSQSFELVDCQRAADAARWQSICWMSARERCTPARRRLCATSALFS